MAAEHLSLKLLMDRRSNRVLFAEAGKDEVDFLFGLLRMPMGSIVRLLTTKHMVGCIGNVYSSVRSLDNTYFIQPEQDKNVLLMKPRDEYYSPPSSLSTLLLDQNDSSSSSFSSVKDASSIIKKYFTCTTTGCFNSTNTRGTVCPSCNTEMTGDMIYIKTNARKVAMDGGGDHGQRGYVKNVVPYIVMDDLSVMPISTISIIALFNSFHAKGIGLGVVEGLLAVQDCSH